ncbi:MAG TPA: DUF4926 domain-containing protein [Ardenticatenaceae bacterium]|jgi:hypothetical protein
MPDYVTAAPGINLNSPYRLFQQVALTWDVVEHGLKRGDLATIVEHHPTEDREDGYSLEVFDALGETIAVITLPASALQPLSANDILHVRSFTAA